MTRCMGGGIGVSLYISKELKGIRSHINYGLFTTPN